MNKIKIKNAILAHIASSIEGELHDWDNLKEWLSYKLKTNEEEDFAEKIMNEEIKRLSRRVK